jgi:hypothetical protein
MDIDPQLEVHQLAFDISSTLDLATEDVTYNTRNEKTPAGAVLSTHERTQLHLSDQGGNTIAWHITIDVSETQNSQQIIVVAGGELDLTYTPLISITNIMCYIARTTHYYPRNS